MKIMKCLPLVALLPLPLMAGGVGGIETGVTAAKIGELGESYGLEAGYYVTPRFRVRLNHSSVSYETARTIKDVQFVEKLDQKNTAISADWFLAREGQGAYASLGVIGLGNEAKLRATPISTAGLTFNGTTYVTVPPIDGVVETASHAPIVGAGYRYSPKSRGWFWQANAGYVFNLDPQLKLTPEVNLAGTLARDLQIEADKKRAELDDSYAIYGITIGYRF